MTAPSIARRHPAGFDRPLRIAAVALIAAACTLASIPAAAQDTGAGGGYGPRSNAEDEAASLLPAASSLATGFSYQLDTDLDSGGGFDVWRAFFDGVFDVALTDRFAVVSHVDYRADVYGFEDTPLVNGDSITQWGLIHTPRFEPLFAFEIGDDWRIFIGPVLEFSFEGGADMRNAFRGGALVAAEYKVNDRLRVGLGALGVNSLDEGAYVQPVLLLDWSITDALSAHVESWTTRGGEAELSYVFLEQFEASAMFGYRREQFRLRERVNTPLPNLKIPIHVSDGLAEDRAFIAGLRLSWLPTFEAFNNVMGNSRFDFTIDGALGGRLTVLDKAGAVLLESDYDPAPLFGFAIYVPFPP